jgi:AcrR family transcriptional regulator
MPVGPHRDDRIRAAVLELLRSRGPKAVNIEAVAAHAGVAKTTIYRRYRDRDEMIAAALRSLTSPPPPPDQKGAQPILRWLIEQSANAVEAGIGVGGVAALLTDQEPGFTKLIRALLVEHRAALAREITEAASTAGLREDLDIDTLLDCIVGAYLAERARRGSVEPGWTDRVLRNLWPAFVRPAEPCTTEMVPEA